MAVVDPQTVLYPDFYHCDKAHAHALRVPDTQPLPLLFDRVSQCGSQEYGVILPGAKHPLVPVWFGSSNEQKRKKFNLFFFESLVQASACTRMVWVKQ